MAEQVTRKPYIREVSRTLWFLEHPRYIRYMAREVTCLFVGGFAVLLLVAIWRLSQGRVEYEAFLQALQSPGSIALLVLALVFSLYHSITWFNLTPQALPVQVGEKFLPGAVIAGAHYVVWLVFSVIVFHLAGVF